MSKRIFQIGLSLLLALLCLISLGNLRRDPQYQKDFRVFYHAAQDRAAGINPYQAATDQTPGFIYPPYVLNLFAPFTHLPLDVAATLYLRLHALAALAAALLWLIFLGQQRDIYFFLFAILGFNTTLMLDLQAGNVSAFEQLLIWLGMAAFLHKKDGWFCLCILAGAAFKLTPLALLGLLLLRRGRRGAAWFAAAVAAAGILLALAYAAQSVLFRQFLSSPSWTAISIEHSTVNPALWPLMRDAFRVLATMGWHVPPRLPDALCCILVALILLVSFKAWRNAQRRAAPDLDRLAIVLLCLVYALVMPRMKDYSYMLLLAPAYYAIKTMVRLEAALPLLLLAIVPTAATSARGVGTLAAFLQQYFSYWLALLLWVLVCRRLLEVAPAPAGTLKRT